MVTRELLRWEAFQGERVLMASWIWQVMYGNGQRARTVRATVTQKEDRGSIMQSIIVRHYGDGPHQIISEW